MEGGACGATPPSVRVRCRREGRCPHTRAGSRGSAYGESCSYALGPAPRHYALKKQLLLALDAFSRTALMDPPEDRSRGYAVNSGNLGMSHVLRISWVVSGHLGPLSLAPRQHTCIITEVDAVVKWFLKQKNTPDKSVSGDVMSITKLSSTGRAIPQ